MTATASLDPAHGRERARPLAPDDRRTVILDAVLPLLRERGRGVSSRELAAAAGIAEGTLFRAFGSKEQLIETAVARIFDAHPLWAQLRDVDASLPLEHRLAAAMDAMRRHFRGVAAAAVALGVRERPATEPADENGLVDALAVLVGPDAARLAVPLSAVADYLTLVSFASSLPMVPVLGDELLAGFVARGILRAGTEEANA